MCDNCPGYFLGASADELVCTAKTPGQSELWAINLAARPQVITALYLLVIDNQLNSKASGRLVSVGAYPSFLNFYFESRRAFSRDVHATGEY